MPASPPSARVENGCRSPASISCSGHGVNALLRWPHALMVTGTLLILHSPKVSPLQQRLFGGISPAGSSLLWWSVIHGTLAVNSNESYGLSSVDEGHAQPPRRGNLVVQREGHQRKVEPDEHRVDCELWIENGEGEVTARGYAAVTLPSVKK